MQLLLQPIESFDGNMSTPFTTEEEGVIDLIFRAIRRSYTLGPTLVTKSSSGQMLDTATIHIDQNGKLTLKRDVYETIVPKADKVEQENARN